MVAVKAAPVIHVVIADEVIRLGVGRNEYNCTEKLSSLCTTGYEMK